MLFLRFYNFLNTKARLIVSMILFLSKKVCMGFPFFFFGNKYKHMLLCTRTYTLFWHFVWLFSYGDWPPHRLRTGCPGTLFFEIRICIRWLHGVAYFNTRLHLTVFGCSDDTGKLTWSLISCLTPTPAVGRLPAGLCPVCLQHAVHWARITLCSH